VTRRFIALALATALLAGACSEAFEPPQDGGGATPGPVATDRETPSPPPSPVPSPVEMAMADLPSEGDAPLHVKVLGWLRTGGSVFCRGETCGLELVDPRDPTEDVYLDVVRDGSSPNTMAPIGSSFEEADLEVIAADGSVLRSGDHVLVTGWWDPDGNTLTPEAIARKAAPKLAPVASTFNQLRTRKLGTLVKVSGRLETPFLLSCGGRNGTCNLYLSDVKDSGKTVRIEVRLSREGESRPVTMRPLGDSFRDTDLRVFDVKKRSCRAGERVTVVGWVYRTDDGTPYIEPVQSITRIGK
jgi:hypothetical protein